MSKIINLNDALNRIVEIKNINQQDFDDEEIERPNLFALNTCETVIKDLAKINLLPNKVDYTVESGMYMSFKKNNDILHIEFYNDGDMAYVIENFITKSILDNKNISSLNEVVKTIEKFMI